MQNALDQVETGSGYDGSESSPRDSPDQYGMRQIQAPRQSPQNRDESYRFTNGTPSKVRRTRNEVNHPRFEDEGPRQAWNSYAAGGHKKADARLFAQADREHKEWLRNQEQVNVTMNGNSGGNGHGGGTVLGPILKEFGANEHLENGTMSEKAPEKNDVELDIDLIEFD